jgi:hypothetical protein
VCIRTVYIIEVIQTYSIFQLSSISMRTGSCVAQQQNRGAHTPVIPQPPLHPQQLPVVEQQLPMIEQQLHIASMELACPQELQIFQAPPELHHGPFPETPQFLAVPVPSVISFPAIQPMPAPVPSVISFPTIQPMPAPPEIGIMIKPNPVQMQDQVRNLPKILSHLNALSANTF